MTFTLTTQRILNDLLGLKGCSLSSYKTLSGDTLRVSPINVSSVRELQAVRALEAAQLVFLFMTGEKNAYPQYYVVAGKDFHSAKETMREMYVNEACDDVLYA